MLEKIVYSPCFMYSSLTEPDYKIEFQIMVYNIFIPTFDYRLNAREHLTLLYCCIDHILYFLLSIFDIIVLFIFVNFVLSIFDIFVVFTCDSCMLIYLRCETLLSIVNNDLNTCYYKCEWNA